DNCTLVSATPELRRLLPPSIKAHSGHSVSGASSSTSLPQLAHILAVSIIVCFDIHMRTFRKWLLLCGRKSYKEYVSGRLADVARIPEKTANHPSGDATTSEADITVSRDLIRFRQFLKIELLDHVIIGTAATDRPDHQSLR